MFKKYFLIFPLLLCSVVLFAEEFDFPKLTEEDLPGIEFKREQIFKGEELYGYINGGAEVYLEYGFEALSLQEFLYQGFIYKVQIYKMRSPEDAFGIFSLFRYACGEDSLFEKLHCVTKYQTKIINGAYLIEVSSGKTCRENDCEIIEIARLVLSRMEQSEYDIPGLFKIKDFLPFQNNIQYFAGEIALRNAFSEWSEKFSSYSNWKMYFIKLKMNGKYYYFADITFDKENDVNSFYEQHGLNINNKNMQFNNIKRGKQYVWWIAPNRILYAQSYLKKAPTKILGQHIKYYVNDNLKAE